MFFINIIIDYINNFLKSLLREKEVNSNLFNSGNNSSLSILILNIVHYKRFSLSKY